MFLTATFLLIAGLSALAEETTTVELTEAGTLATAVGDNKSTITDLTVSGPINSNDVATMKDMAKNGALSVLDISGATAATADLIGSDAFYECSKLTSISLPYGITSIGEWAFSACTSLTSITFSDDVISIGGGAFASCSNLASITIPNSVTSIGDYAFYGCTRLASVTIGNSVTSIGQYAFSGCSSLTEVTLRGKTLPLTCATNAFDNIDLSKATLYCKAALVETCKKTAPWLNFKNIVVKSFSVSISDAGIATGCFDDDLDFSKVTGVKAYIASGFNPETGKVLMTNVTEVPAGTGFLVKGTEDTYEIPAAATKYVYVNMLVGTLEETTVAQTEDSYTNYVLGKETDGVVGFYLADRTVVLANKAYLQLPTSAVTTSDTSEAKTSLRLSFDDMDDTTGITQIREQTDSASGKTVIYNLNGQRKQSLTKGLNIVNGKKIFVK